MGPALASSVAAWANVVLLARVLHRRKQFVVDDLLNRRAVRMVAASLAMGVVLFGLQETLFAAVAHRGQLLRGIGLAVLVGGGMATYAAAGQAFGAFDFSDVLRRLARRRGRAAAKG
jgi:putative peptidoglycan lipid II flippase